MQEIVIQIQENRINVDAPETFSWGDIDKALRALSFDPDHTTSSDVGGGYHTHHFTI